MIQHGGDIYDKKVRIDFSVNTNPFGMPEGVRRAAAAGVAQSEHYPDPAYRELKAAIANWEAVPGSWIVCGNGAAELIYALVSACQPKRALLPVPGFAEYEAALAAAGCELDFYELEESQGFELDEGFVSRITADTDMVWLCNPNNPTGTIVSRPLMEQIMMRCHEADIVLVVDECFIDFLDEPGQYTVKESVGRYDKLVLLKAFTKLYAMPGLRLGYLLCQNAGLRERLGAVMQPWSLSLPAQLAGVAALKEAGYRSESCAYVKQEREFMKDALTSAGLQVYGSHASYLFFKGRPGLKEACLKEDLLIRDCSNYPGLTQGYYRIAVRRHEENLELLRCISAQNRGEQ